MMGTSFFTNSVLVSLIGCFSLASVLSQNTSVKGRILDAHSYAPIAAVQVSIEETGSEVSSDANGEFGFVDDDIPPGPHIIRLRHPDYNLQRMKVTVRSGQTVSLDPILLTIDLSTIQSQIGVISLSEEELDQDEGTIFNISGLLFASKDVFLNAAAYDFSQTFFRPRGLDATYAKLLINGIEMNKIQNGRPQWSNWGGLNDVQRNRDFSMGMRVADINFGDIAGTTNINMRASSIRSGGSVSYAAANRSYRGRAMGSFSSGPTLSGWAYSLMISRRYGDRGFTEGTPYEANSFFASLEKKLTPKHSINATAFFTPNRRGRSTALTEEVKTLKGVAYNPLWGYQNGIVRSSRVRRIEEPVVMLNHYWQLSDKSQINTNVAYQFGRIGNTRLDYSGNRNPSPNYYQRLPSYFLRDPVPSAYDFQLAYLAEQEFIQNGQLDWNALYHANTNSAKGRAIYTVQEDVNKDSMLSFNSILTCHFSKRFSLNSNLSLRSLKSDNFAELRDLLGGEGYLDVDYFGSDPIQSQSNLLFPDRIATTGDKIKYNYTLMAVQSSAFVQGTFRFNRYDLFLAVSAEQSNFQRQGHFQNGYFPEQERSLGKSEKLSYTGIAIKGGVTYKLNGKHFIELNSGLMQKTPLPSLAFANVRQNNDLVENLVGPIVKMADLSYNYRSPVLRSRLTAYYVGLQRLTDIAFFFTQNALGNDETTAFVQEIASGISQRNTGLELGVEAQILPGLKLKAVASIAQYLYAGDAQLYLAGDDFDDPDTANVLEGNDLFTRGFRKVNIKDYHVPSGPERAYQLGFEYRDPGYWWIGLTANYFSNAYVNISKLRRTSDFLTDLDGQPFNNYDSEIAKALLQQEQLPDYLLLNAVGGKSWRIGGYYLGFFASVNNLLNQEYRTGGFEDSRRASYRQQLEEQNRAYGPIFGNRYFFGPGTTYYLNVYVRF
jgi:hypothetical protein